MSSKQYFDKVAQDWDEMRTGFFPESIRTTALSSAAIRTGSLAADLGAGTGFISEALLDHEVSVVAVDQSQEMLDILEQKLAFKGNLTCLQGTADSLPIADATVDYVFANMFLHHVEDPKIAIQEMARILKNRGKVVITDLDRHQHHFLLEEHNDRWPGFEREDVRYWLQKAGFDEVSVNCINQNCCASSKMHEKEAEISIFIAVATRKDL